MLVRVKGAKCIGIDAVSVIVETDISRGIGIHLVGLADAAVKESLLRTVTALESLEYRIPGKKIVINLAPADLHKNGSGYDLPIAIGIIAASGQRDLPLLDKFLIMGELGLDGSVRPIPGALPFAELAANSKLQGIILPAESAQEAFELHGTQVFGVSNLNEAVEILEGSTDCSRLLIENSELTPVTEDITEDIPDFTDIIGQTTAKRGAEIAAAGGHNLALIGSPGSGKSSLAKAIAGILPPMTDQESLVTSKIYSIAGKGRCRHTLMRQRPFRAPHHSASLVAIIGGGGGDNVFPGEVSLAQNGLLFLDEMTLMPKSVLEALRGPLEDRYVTISRLRSKLSYPASFMLVAASNPCPCGYYGEGDRCICTPAQRMSYLSKLSGPLMDRIDIHLAVSSVNPLTLSGKSKAECSSSVAARVQRARDIQTNRYRDESIMTNAELTNKLIEKYCPLSPECTTLMAEIMEKSGMSMRAYFRILKVARTIADLSDSPAIKQEHLLEAISFRFLDRRQF